MNTTLTKDRRIFEIMLIVVTIGMTMLLYRLGAHKMVALNLFFLPIVLSGYFLGRNSAGILALFCALAVTLVVTADASGFAAYTSPLVVGLALTIWAAVLGLTALLVGTLCDDRARTVKELEVAYVGVIEVLTRYLQSGNPKIKTSSVRVAELCQRVAESLKLPRKQIDDVRIGALLHDLGNVEITTTLINKAVSSLEGRSASARHTFLGTDLVQSLGTVLHGALPLLVSQDDGIHELVSLEGELPQRNLPIGARIIRAVRAYDRLTDGRTDGPPLLPEEAIRELRADTGAGFDPDILNALDRLQARAIRPASVREPVMA